MQHFDLHVCLISDQAAPNLLPVLDTNFKPKEAIFLVSAQKKQQAEFLTKTFESKGVKVTKKELSDIFNFEAMENEIIDFIQEYEEQNIALNVTGGTKLLAIAAQNAFSLLEKPIFYIDTDQNRIVFISKDNQRKHIPDEALNTNINLPTYLASYGFNIVKQGKLNTKEYHIEMRDDFIKKYDDFSEAVPTLNFYAAKANKNNPKVKLDYATASERFIELVGELHTNDLLDFKDGELNFYDEENRNFVAGGWLEDYVFEQVKSIKSIQDCELNIEVANSIYNANKHNADKNNKGNLNEFDVAFLAKNKLHIIECKTQRFDNKSDSKPEDILYKLETIKDYGGLMTKKCLVTYLPVSDAVKNRAKTLRIEIVEGKDIQRLKEKLQNWIGR